MIHANENTGMNNRLIPMRKDAKTQAGYGNQAMMLITFIEQKPADALMRMHIVSPIPDKFNLLKSYS